MPLAYPLSRCAGRFTGPLGTANVCRRPTGPLHEMKRAFPLGQRLLSLVNDEALEGPCWWS